MFAPVLFHRRVKRRNRCADWSFHLVKQASLSFMNFISSKLTQIIHDRVSSDRSLYLYHCILFGGLSLPPFDFFHLPFFLLFSLLLVVLLCHAPEPPLFGTCERTPNLLNFIFLVELYRSHVHKVILK